MSETNLTTTDMALAPDKAAQLAVIEYRIHDHMTNAAGHLLAVGQCLNEAKAGDLVPHGEWEAWVAKNTGFTVRQAQRMMQAARQVPEGSTLAQLPFTKIQACLQLPSAEDREAMAQRAQDEGLTLRQLQEEVKKANQRADQAEAKRREVEGNLRSHDAQAAHERSQLRFKLAAAEARADAEARAAQDAEARAAQAAAAGGISPEAQAEIDRLRAELSDAEEMVERQADLRQQAQQELLNLKAQAARGEAAIHDAGMTPMELAAAVRAFVGTAGVLPHMGAILAQASESDRQEMRSYIDMMAEWVEGARSALKVVYIDGDCSFGGD